MTEFEQLYRAYFSDVYSYLKSLTGDEHLAGELTSDTFFRALQNLPSYREKGSAKGWLFRIAKNLYLDHLRKSRRLQPLETLPESALPPDPAPGPAAVAQADSEALRLHRLVHRLPEPGKEVFLLRVYGELSFAQIGAVFGKTANWACVTYHRARQKLREEMEAQQDGEEL